MRTRPPKALTMDELADRQKRLNLLMAPAREVLIADRGGLRTLGERHGWSPQPGSTGSHDLHDLRWQPKGHENLFLSTTHRMTHRLLALENFLDGLVHLLRDHAPVFSLYPVARSAILAAARIHAVVSLDDDEARAAQALHDWLYAIEQQMRTMKAVEADKTKIAERRRRRQSLADRYGFALMEKSLLRSKRTEHQYSRTSDGNAIEALLRPSFTDLKDPQNRGTGPLAWSLMSAFVHADPLHLIDHLEVRPAEEADGDVKSWTRTQIHGDRIGTISLFAHNATGDLIDALYQGWGWDIGDWRPAWIERTRRLVATYLPTDLGDRGDGRTQASANS